MRAILSVIVLFTISFLAGSCRAQDAKEISSLCDLQKKIAEGNHVSARISGIYSGAPELGYLEDAACPGQRTLVRFALRTQRNKKKLAKIFDPSPRGRALVVFDCEFYGPPAPDPKMPEPIRKNYHPGWDYEVNTKLVVRVIRDVKPAPPIPDQP
jgi:hypothetical protein